MSSVIQPWKKLQITMRDGIILSCRLYLPDLSSGENCVRCPSVLCLCTDYSTDHEKLFSHFSRGGLACLELLFRGRGDSGGEFSLGRLNFHDLEDFFQWLCRQTWYDGHCAFYGEGPGASFGLQFSQVHPELVQGLILSSFIANYSCQGICTNGVFDLPCLGRLLDLACTSPRCRENPGIRQALQGMRERFTAYARYWPFAPGSTPLSLLPEYEEIAGELSRCARYGQTKLHRQYTVEQFFAGFPEIPMLLFGEWQDDRLRSVLKAYYELSYRREKNLQCFIGRRNPASDAAAESPFYGDFCYRDYTLGWLRHHLGLDADRQFAEKKICYQNLHPAAAMTAPERSPPEPESWDQAVFWPPEEQDLLFYLQKDHLLTTVASRSDCGRSGSTFCSDPRAEMPPEQEGGSSGQGSSADQLLENFLPYLRGDRVSFLTPPLKKEVKISGNVQVRLFLHCTAPDGDLHCRLSCRLPVPEQGPLSMFSVPLCDSIQRFSYYQQTHIASTRQPEYCRLYEFSLSPVAAVLPQGCRLQLDLAGSHFPRYAVSNQTGIADLQGISGPVAYYRIYHNQQCPSCMILPVRLLHSRRKISDA